MGVLVYLTADWILFFYTSETRILYPFEFQSFVSYVTIIPSILLLTGTLEFSIRTDNVVATQDDLQYCKVLRVLSINRLEQSFINKGFSLEKAIFKLVNDVFCLILLFTCSMLVTENILYILPYCQTYDQRKEAFEAETNTEYVDNTMDSMCGNSQIR